MPPGTGNLQLEQAPTFSHQWMHSPTSAVLRTQQRHIRNYREDTEKISKQSVKLPTTNIELIDYCDVIKKGKIDSATNGECKNTSARISFFFFLYSILGKMAEEVTHVYGNIFMHYSILNNNADAMTTKIYAITVTISSASKCWPLDGFLLPFFFSEIRYPFSINARLSLLIEQLRIPNHPRKKKGIYRN